MAGFVGMLVVAALGLAACSNGSSAKVSVAHSSKLGAAVLTVSGQAVYVHLTSSGAVAPCTVACLSVWPAVDASAVPPATSGVHASLLSTMELAGGTRILTYAGRPLYYFGRDTAAHVRGEGLSSFGGSWYAVAPSGKPIIGPAQSLPTSTSHSNTY